MSILLFTCHAGVRPEVGDEHPTSVIDYCMANCRPFGGCPSTSSRFADYVLSTQSAGPREPDDDFAPSRVPPDLITRAALWTAVVQCLRDCMS